MKLKLKTHYVRVPPREAYPFANAFESVVNACVPTDRLAVDDDIMARVAASCRKEGEPPPTRLAFFNALEALVKAGAVKEIYGLRLERLVESL
jgi:hypothetical protein